MGATWPQVGVCGMEARSLGPRSSVSLPPRPGRRRGSGSVRESWRIGEENGDTQLYPDEVAVEAGEWSLFRSAANHPGNVFPLDSPDDLLGVPVSPHRKHPGGWVSP